MGIGGENSGNGSTGKRRGAAGRSRAQPKKRPAGAIADAEPRGSAALAKPQPPRFGVPVWTGGNRILAALPQDELAFLRPHLTTVSTTSGHVLYEQRAVIETVYFPDTAVASLISRMTNGIDLRSRT